MVCNHDFTCLNGNGNGVVQEPAGLIQTTYKSTWLHFEDHRVEPVYSSQELELESAAETIRQTVLLRKRKEQVQPSDLLSPVLLTD